MVRQQTSPQGLITESPSSISITPPSLSGWMTQTTLCYRAPALPPPAQTTTTTTTGSTARLTPGPMRLSDPRSFSLRGQPHQHKTQQEPCAHVATPETKEAGIHQPLSSPGRPTKNLDQSQITPSMTTTRSQPMNSARPLARLKAFRGQDFQCPAQPPTPSGEP